MVHLFDMPDQNKKKKSNGQRAERLLTKKGLTTRRSLLEAAQDVFRNQGYYGASVSMICRRAKMSQGAFYQYFKNKEQALLEVNDLILNDFWSKAENASLASPEPEIRLERVVALLFQHAREYNYYHRILGEFELIDSVSIKYYDSLCGFFKSFFQQETSRKAIQPMDPEMLSYALIGMALFHAMDWGPEGEEYPQDQLVKWAVALLRRGISGPKPWNGRMPPQKSPSLAEQDEGPVNAGQGMTQGQATAQALFQAAETIFGQVGFNRAGIADITRLAGVAQGTFYIHFKSKRDLMAGFVDYLSREMRWSIKKDSSGRKDRRNVESAGMRAFFRFLSSHRRIYRVVAESETMGKKMAMRYYKKLAEGYEPGLAEGAARDEIIKEPPVPFLVRSIMGMIHMVGVKWLVWSSSSEEEIPASHVDEVIDLILSGLDFTPS